MKRFFLISIIFFSTIILCLGTKGFAHADENDTYTLKISGTYNFDKAQELLSFVNDERGKNGKSRVEIDEELTNAAMQRAAELSVDFNHNRPDGKNCYSINDKVSGENIAAGQTSAERVFDSWKESYGHYENMIYGGYKSIGIGSFTVRGTTYWVQLFSGSNSEKTDKRNGVSNGTPSIEIKEGNYPLSLDDRDEIEKIVGETEELCVYRFNPGWSYRYGVFTSDSFNWSSSNKAVVTVNSKGVITAKGAGTAVIKAVPKQGTGYASVKINCKKNIADTTVKLSKERYTYSGKANTPSVKVYDGNTLLKNGEDYDLSYYRNTDAGTAIVKIKGAGKYAGEKEVDFIVSPLDVGDKITSTISSYNYSGYKDVYDFLRDNVTVKYNGKALKYDKDYYFGGSVTSADGYIAHYTVVMIWNYSGRKEFSNLSKGYAKGMEDMVYAGKPINPKFKVYYDLNFASWYPDEFYKEGTDYSYSFSNNVNAGTATLKVKGENNCFGGFTQEFEIKPAAITSAELDKTAVFYTGKEIKNKATVRAIVDGKNIVLKEGTDYSISYKNNKKIGTATAIIKGKGNFEGTIEKNYEIVDKKSCRFIDVTNPKDWYYKAVHWAADKGIVTGSNGYFYPDRSCTREQAITFLWRMAGKPEPKSMKSKFSDVKDTKSYSYKAIMWGNEKGLIFGFKGKFNPKGTCTREQIVTMIWRMAGKPNPKTTTSKFKDVKNKKSYSYKAILWANEKGIAKGSNGKFSPTEKCKRRDIVTFIYRYKN